MPDATVRKIRKTLIKSAVPGRREHEEKDRYHPRQEAQNQMGTAGSACLMRSPCRQPELKRRKRTMGIRLTSVTARIPIGCGRM